MRIGVTLKAGLPLAAALSLVFASTSLAAPAPPFNQCPAVGYDTSCQSLIDFGSTGTATVVSDPSQIAFDGVEDTLIGVQNDSPVTINSFKVMATSGSTVPPFQFDGDGACSGVNSQPGLGTFNPPPGDCPFGPTGYEGPGVSYTAISSDTNSGTINVQGGIAPGGTAWFSLEGQVTAGSITVVPPPTVTITTPANGAKYAEGSSVNADYSCADPGGPGIKSCRGPVPNGSPIDTSKPGSFCFTVTAKSLDGQSASATNCYTVTPTPLTYTGDAFNLYAKATSGANTILGPTTVNEVGPISTMQNQNNSNTIVSESLPALGLTGSQLKSSVITGGGQSVGDAKADRVSLNLPLLGVPGIVTGQVRANSKTSCKMSTDAPHSRAYTTVASLLIGGVKIRIPRKIPRNFTISLGPLGSVTLNERIAIPNGLAVNAIHINLLTNLGLGSVDVIIGHAESDLEGC